ncbi:MAG: hypothetical protein IIT36_04445 [Aeriscardovia sp.]|nr:hypothetical protein [Aeriscardovia sp.]
MSETSTASADAKTTRSVGRNSIIMASGTLASRLTGQARTILLVAAVGVTGMAANAYQVGSQIPRVVFNLLEGGLINAILVPQIVRAFKHKDFSDRINKLLTLAISTCFGFMVLLMISTPLLVRLYTTSDWTNAQRALASSFTLWCMPQILFYGIYTVVGQVLAARDNFTAYAWSSVASNVIACAGYILFLVLFGHAQTQPLDFWTPEKIAVLGGAWTLGIGVQALILFVPLIKEGIHPHIKWGVHGIGLRSMGKVAGWTFAAVVLNQVAGLVNTRIETAAPAVAGNRLTVAGAQAYAQTFQLWILPYSLVTVSIATSVFPAISRAVEAHRIDDARDALSGSLRSSGTIMPLFTAFFIAMPVPIVRALLPSVGVYDANLIATPLVAMSLNLVPYSVTLLLNRVFYAYEDGKSPFFLALVQNIVQVGALLITIKFVTPDLWVACIGASSTVSNLVLMPISYLVIKRRMGGRIGARPVASVYLKAFVGAALTVMIGILASGVTQHALHASTAARGGHMSWIQAVAVCATTGIIMMLFYWGVLHMLHVEEIDATVNLLLAKVPHRRPNAADEVAATDTDGTATTNATTTRSAQSTGRISSSSSARQGRHAPRTARGAASYAILANMSSTADASNANAQALADEPFALMSFMPRQQSVHYDRSALSTSSQTPGAASFRGPRSASSSFRSGFRFGSAPQPAGQPEPRPTQPESPRSGAGSSGAFQPTPPRRQFGERIQTPAQPNGGPMIPAIGDTIDNRYTLITQYRSEPGLSAWLANDHTLMRDCQLFIISNRAKLAEVNALASSLVLSRDPHVTRVLHLQKTGDVSVIVTDTDPGVSLHEFLASRTGQPLSPEVMRGICFQIIDALRSLRNQSLSSDVLDSRVVRLTSKGVTIADTSVSPLLTTRIHPEDFTVVNREALAIKQIAGMLYEMATGSEFDPTGDTSAAARLLQEKGKNLPEEFLNICRRALNIPVRSEFESDKPLPILTLLELEMLLGERVDLSKLPRSEYSLPSAPGEASIAIALFAPAAAHDIVDIPDSLISSAMVKPVGAGHEAATSVKRRGMSQWDSNQLLRGGNAVEELSPEDSNLFSAFDTDHPVRRTPTHGRTTTSAVQPRSIAPTGNAQRPITPGQTPNKTGALTPAQLAAARNAARHQNAQAMRAQRARAMGTSRPAQTGMDGADPTVVNRGPNVARSRNAHNMQYRNAVAFAANSANPRMAANRAPIQRDQHRNPYAVRGPQSVRPVTDAETKKKGGLARTTIITVVIIILAVLLGWCIKSLDLGSFHLGNDDSHVQWNLNVNSAPIPGGKAEEQADANVTGADVGSNSSSSSSANVKNAQAVPAPESTNTTAYTISSTQIVRSANLRGLGLQIHLVQPEPVQKIVVTTRYGGGQAAVYANSTAQDPQNGTPLVNFSFSPNGQTTVVFPSATQTQDLVIWVSQSPAGGFYYQSVKVY